MRPLGIALALTLSSMAVAAKAAEFSPTSRITSVVVFPSGAEVTRMATAHLSAGDHTLSFTDLPVQAVAASIRVEGKATGRLEIGAVDTRHMHVPRADPAQLASERRTIEQEIEKLRDQRAVAEADVKASATQLALIEKLANLPDRPLRPNETTTGPQPDWNQLFALIGQRSAEAQKAALDSRNTIRDLDRRIEDLQKKLAALAPAQDQRIEVKVSVAAAAPLEAELTIRYQVGSATWVPYYDARLATGTHTTPPKLDLARRASIQQRTTEDWKDITLQLSTTRPGPRPGRAAAPPLQSSHR